MADRALSDSQTMVDAHGDFLYRFALVRVRNPDVAEDLVQETFLAALQGSHHGTGPMAERGWMIGIMKHKIIDYFRRTTREPVLNPVHPDCQTVDEEFLANGHWNAEGVAMQEWPDRLLERRQFWDALTVCLERLPPRAAQVFTLREMDEVETEKICALLGLTPTNLGVILYRTRKQLRDCLARWYFGHTQEGVE